MVKEDGNEDYYSYSSDYYSYSNEDPPLLSSTVSDISKFTENEYYWNEQFQRLIESPVVTPEQIQHREKAVESLTQKFSSLAIPIAKQIVMEMNLKPEERTYKPANVGGIAGGIKYITKQMFFKVAVDNTKDQKLFGGDEFSQKTASHELLSMNRLISCHIPGLHFPLMILVSCYGHRVLCVSKLPIDGDTLIHGSSNGGAVIHSSQEIEKRIKTACQMLNLREHYVIERSTKEKKLIRGPVDLEGHLGRDGRFYIVDTARLFPPTTRLPNIRGAYMFKLMRPELVKKYAVPLSSDMFSGWGATQPELEEDGIKATDNLCQHIIPSLAEEIKSKDTRELTSFPSELTTFLHKNGINVRFMGLLFIHLKGSPNQKIILCEMIARSWKTILNRLMRQLGMDNHFKGKNKARTPEDYKGLVVYLLNTLTARSEEIPIEESKNLWTSIREEISTKFFDHLLWKNDGKEELKEEENESDKIELVDYLLDNDSDYYYYGYGSKNSKDNLKASQGQNTDILSNSSDFEEILLDIQRFLEKKFKSENGKKSSVEISKGGEEERIEIEEYIKWIPWIIQRSCELMNLKLDGNFEDDSWSELNIQASSKLCLFGGVDSMQSGDVEDFYLSELKNRSAVLGSKHPQIALILVHLAEYYKDSRQPGESKKRFQEALEILNHVEGREEDVAYVLDSLADLAIQQDEYNIALNHLQNSMKLKKEVYGESHYELSTTMTNLAGVYVRLDDLNKAEGFYTKALKIAGNNYPNNHPKIARILNNQGQLRLKQKKFPEAAKLLDTAVTSLLNESSSELAVALDNRGKAYYHLNQGNEANGFFERSLEVKKKFLGEEHFSVGITLNHLASVKVFPRTNKLSKFTSKATEKQILEAQKQFEVAKGIFSKWVGKGHSASSILSNNIAGLKIKQQLESEAKKSLQESHEYVIQTFGKSHSLPLAIKKNLEFLSSPRGKTYQGSSLLQFEILFHDSFIGFPPGRSLEVRSIPMEWKKLFQDAGITEEVLQDEEKLQQIMQIIGSMLHDKKALSSSRGSMASSVLSRSTLIDLDEYDQDNRADSYYDDNLQASLTDSFTFGMSSSVREERSHESKEEEKEMSSEGSFDKDDEEEAGEESFNEGGFESLKSAAFVVSKRTSSNISPQMSGYDEELKDSQEINLVSKSGSASRFDSSFLSRFTGAIQIKTEEAKNYFLGKREKGQSFKDKSPSSSSSSFSFQEEIREDENKKKERLRRSSKEDSKEKKMAPLSASAPMKPSQDPQYGTVPSVSLRNSQSGSQPRREISPRGSQMQEALMNIHSASDVPALRQSSASPIQNINSDGGLPSPDFLDGYFTIPSPQSPPPPPPSAPPVTLPSPTPLPIAPIESPKPPLAPPSRPMQGPSSYSTPIKNSASTTPKQSPNVSLTSSNQTQEQRAQEPVRKKTVLKKPMVSKYANSMNTANMLQKQQMSNVYEAEQTEAPPMSQGKVWNAPSKKPQQQKVEKQAPSLRQEIQQKSSNLKTPPPPLPKLEEEIPSGPLGFRAGMLRELRERQIDSNTSLKQALPDLSVLDKSELLQRLKETVGGY
eukprot:TRINITY_DN4294_c0_g1_i2.p1 TRINITY_DN4294_c0_g1~~TRINITY_DN4294_c0_g1_i2.p1  ORF type:complete len:1562 (-),score=510.85 TRINITY_DN4294_c0_g1_i2:353-5038(-)